MTKNFYMHQTNNIEIDILNFYLDNDFYVDSEYNLYCKSEPKLRALKNTLAALYQEFDWQIGAVQPNVFSLGNYLTNDGFRYEAHENLIDNERVITLNILHHTEPKYYFIESR